MTVTVRPQAEEHRARQDPVVLKAAVIGAGSMGAGIAAQFANAGIPVVLLDIPAKAGLRDAIARSGVERQLKVGGFMHADAVHLVTIGNMADDLALLADADWIVEAIVENREVKQELFARIEAVRKPDSAISSNTSTLRREDIIAGLGQDFDRNFAVTHFFNPPRHMRLMEIVCGPNTAPETRAKIEATADIYLGKTVVAARDTPGFIANRVGCYWMAVSALEALHLGLPVEEADAVLSRPFGIPKTGVFGLFDLVGIDLVEHIWKSLEETLPIHDDLHNFRLTHDPVFADMIRRGLIGRKAKAGFYRQDANGGRQVFDLVTLTYRAETIPDLPAFAGGGRDLATLIASEGRAGAYAWSVLSRTVTYAAAAAPEIAGHVADIDLAMKLGYAWSMGPFELADRVGPAVIADRLIAEGRPVPPLLAEAAQRGAFYPETGDLQGSDTAKSASPPTSRGRVSLTAIRRTGSPVIETSGGALWDIGEGVGCFQLKTKMNVFEPSALEALERTIADGPSAFRALIVGHDDLRAFSAGANLGMILEMITAGDFKGLDSFIARGQAAFGALKYSPLPVVGAAFGLALGGGCEVLLHCDAIVAHCELNVGLPEVKVGLVPGWGGCAQLLARFNAKGSTSLDPLGPTKEAFQVIISGAVSTSAAAARDLAILRSEDTITMNRDRLLHDAKTRAMQLAETDYVPPEKLTLRLPGPLGKVGLMDVIRNRSDIGIISEVT